MIRHGHTRGSNQVPFNPHGQFDAGQAVKVVGQRRVGDGESPVQEVVFSDRTQCGSRQPPRRDGPTAARPQL